MSDPTRTYTLNLRLPRGLADQLRAASIEEGKSMNRLAVFAIEDRLRGNKPPAERLDKLEEDLTRLARGVAAIGGEVQDIAKRLGQIERLAESQAYS